LAGGGGRESGVEKARWGEMGRGEEWGKSRGRAREEGREGKK
jgi:hypothetical protein